ncbi:MAG: glucuronate isomerase [Planctomycetota bacterium]
MTTMLDRTRLALTQQPIVDMHTHCYPPSFGHSGVGGGDGMLLWGIDQLLTYHYLVAEVYRVVPATELPYDTFFAMTTREQADHIWRHLFIERTPISEACRGVITTLGALGLDPNERSLDSLRSWFEARDANTYVDTVMETSGVESITMTNAVFDDEERSLWLEKGDALKDPRFEAVLRIDPLLQDWPSASAKLGAWGYGVSEELTPRTIAEAKRFITDWLTRMDAIYVAMSLPPGFRYPDPSNPTADRIIAEILMPVLADHGLPWAMMIGSRRHVNPALGQAGDMVGKADVQAVVNLCRDFPRNRFLVTMLSRENQHELCVAARKFGNLMVFGCWWFLNNPSIIEEMTRERFELLGTTVIPQHSDARVLDQLIYKWSHSREIIARCLATQYEQLDDTGYRVTDEHIGADAERLMRGNFRSFITAEQPVEA